MRVSRSRDYVREYTCFNDGEFTVRDYSCDDTKQCKLDQDL